MNNCNEKFPVDNAFHCNYGGHIAIRHEQVRDTLMQMMMEIIPKSRFIEESTPKHIDNAQVLSNGSLSIANNEADALRGDFAVLSW